jgi:glucose/arabinose dehydrogenase
VDLRPPEWESQRWRDVRHLLLCAALAACGGSADRLTAPPDSVTLELDTVATGLSSPLYVASPPNDARLFIVEQTGRIRIVANGALQAAPFLDLHARVSTGGERGLLSVAFHPQYATNGFFFVDFTDGNGDTRVERFHVSADRNVADPASTTLILGVAQPFANHNGGLLMFGPDGMLYIGMGDGGAAGDPLGNGQNRNALLGKLLRIDVNGALPYVVPANNPFVGQAGARGEIWALGLRNPWRFAFDRVAGLLYIADVGQGAREEIDAVGATQGGVNYGWNVMEGTSCYASTTCNRAGLTLPVFDYDHSQGCSITGGFVYRGSRIPEVTGTYFYSDYCRGWLRSIRVIGGTATDARDWAIPAIGAITSFGEDASGELYITAASGIVYRIVRGS